MNPSPFGMVKQAVSTGIAVATTILLLVVAWRLFGPELSLPSLPNPVAQEETVVATPPVLQELTDLRQFHAAEADYEVVVELTRRNGALPAGFMGQSATLVASGEVAALVDFSELGEEQVRVAADGTSATITLPRPTFTDARIDFDASEIVDRDRGVIDRLGGLVSDNAIPERELYTRAARDIEAAARRSMLADRAEANTRDMLEELLGSLGIERVYVSFEEPAFDLRSAWADVANPPGD